MNPELEKAFEQRPKAKKAFEAMPPSHKKAYLEHLNSIKTPQALERNLLKALAKMEDWLD